MKYSEAQAEFDELLDQLMSEENIDGCKWLVDAEIDRALVACQIPMGKRKHARRLLQTFWNGILERRGIEKDLQL